MQVDRFHLLYLVLFTGYLIFTLFITGGKPASVGLLLWNIWWGCLLAKYKMNRLGINLLCVVGFVMFIYNLIHINMFQHYFALSVEERAGYINPNVQAFLLCFYSSMLIVLFTYKFRFYRRWHLGLLQIIVTIWGIVKSGARGALLCFLLFIVIQYFIPMKLKRKERLMLMIYVAIVIAGIIVPIIYVNLYKCGINISYVTSAGKTFYSGREWLWGLVLDALGNRPINWLFGIGSAALETSVHNTFLRVVVDFGLIGYVAYYFFYANRIKEVYENGKPSDLQINMITVCIAAISNGIFEPIILNWGFIIPIAFLWSMPKGLAGIEDRI